MRQKVVPKCMLHTRRVSSYCVEVGDEKNLAEDFRISQNDQAILCPRQRDVQPPRIIQESNPLVLITPHTRNDDVILLSTLKRIDRSDFDFFVEFLLERSV